MSASLFQGFGWVGFGQIPGPSDLGKSSGLVMGDLILILTAGLVVTLLLVLWAVYLRKTHRHHHHHHHHHHRPHSPHDSTADEAEAGDDETAPGESSADASAASQRRRRRRRRRDHRPRNPTLAETGGLPPLRPLEPPAASGLGHASQPADNP